jgi:hypothetical protein
MGYSVSSTILQGAKKAYLKAMEIALAPGVNEFDFEKLPGLKMISITQGEYCVTDMHNATEKTDRLIGMTWISSGSEMIWEMSYEGHFRKDAIPFLRKCLHKAYVKEKRFYGGRGPTHLIQDDRFTYLNQIHADLHSFNHFEGEESIYDRNSGGAPCCHLTYRGGSLIKK